MSQVVESKEVIYEFGNFVLDPSERILLADGKPIRLTDKVFDTLLMLVHHNGRLLTKDEMMASIWEESFVEESNLAKNISRLRKILNVNGSSLIETVPRRGYRFAADVKEIEGDTSLVVRRNLHVKIRVEDDDVETQRRSDTEKDNTALPKLTASPRRRVSASKFAVVLLLFAVISGLGFYFWKREKNAPRREFGGAIRLTDDLRYDTNPRWTSDGRIRFFRVDKDRQAEAITMNADGSGQTVVKEFASMEYGGHWSPDGSKVLFAKRGDKTALYLSNADGSDETALPYFGNMDWSADSKQIVYQKAIEQNRNSEIFVYTIDSRQSINVTNSPAFDADPAFSPDGKQIVFASSRDGNAEIYLMNADGSDVRRLTNHPAWENHPAFSPDGTQIAFNSDRENENSNIFLINPDGSNLRQLTDWTSQETIVPGGWSPDGTRVVIALEKEGNEDVYVMNAEVYHPELVLADGTDNLSYPSYSPDGTKIVYQAELPDKSGELRIFDTGIKQTHVVLKTENAVLNPVFSPDGTRIAFQNKIGNNTEVCSVNIDGSGLKNLTNNEWKDGWPAFSPDGTQIVFSTNRDGNTGIFSLYMMNVDGGNQHRLHSAMGTMSISPVFSPDGSNIVFTNDFAADGNFELFKIRTDRSGAAERLTFRKRSEGNPAFSPDGSLVAFSSDTDGNAEIYLMNADATNLLRLTRNAADDGTPQFSKDGQRIIFSSNRDKRSAIYEINLMLN